MTVLCGPGWEKDSDVVMRFVDKIIDELCHKGINAHTPVAIHADISLPGVLLVMAAIKMGLRFALCPLRDPPQVIADWICELEIKQVLDAHELFEKIEGTQRKKNKTVTKNIQKFSTIIKTSGTTARAKNALILGRAHVASARSFNNYFSLSPNSCFALSLPLFHVSGLSIIVRSLLTGASIFIADGHKQLVHGLIEKKITHLSLVPTQLRRLLDEGVDLSSLHAVIIGGDRLSDDLRTRALLSGIRFFETYGLTETASMVWIKNFRGEDTVLSHAKIIFAEDGEIVVGGASLFSGYVHLGKIDDSIIGDGQFFTGDVVQPDAKNCFTVVGRKSNRIICGGENIQVEEIERVLDAHPLIKESIVVAIADREYEARPCAYIRWIDKKISDEEISCYLKKYLASYKIPKIFKTWPQDAPHGLKKPRSWFMKHSQPLYGTSSMYLS